MCNWNSATFPGFFQIWFKKKKDFFYFEFKFWLTRLGLTYFLGFKLRMGSLIFPEIYLWCNTFNLVKYKLGKTRLYLLAIFVFNGKVVKESTGFWIKMNRYFHCLIFISNWNPSISPYLNFKLKKCVYIWRLLSWLSLSIYISWVESYVNKLIRLNRVLVHQGVFSKNTFSSFYSNSFWTYYALHSILPYWPYLDICCSHV